MSDEPNRPQSELPDGGLPVDSPDRMEEDFSQYIDNIVPTRGYQMLPMVGLGGSAGSIAALQEFFRAMPAENGMVFVVILHLSPEHESALAELLGRCTSMSVVQAQDGERVYPNCVYVIPPGKHLTAIDGHLRLTNLAPVRGKRIAADLFFRSLADTHGPHSAAIVLSGADSDGALGIKRIKERGGLTIVQEPTEADHPEMPRAAIATNMVDWTLPVAQIPQRLLEYFASEKALELPPEEGPEPAEAALPEPPASEAALRDVLTLLRTRTGRDFSYYKRATIVRRLSRRMQVNGVADLPAYLSFLRSHPGETGALLQDLLVSVTNFFRDREAFAALEARLPELFRGKKRGDTVRVWVPACATGEEAFSIAILLYEYARTLDEPPSIQIFATDLDEQVIRTARAAFYAETLTPDVTEDRLRRFFIKEANGYRVRHEIRELVLFALHDLLKDSPFSRLDLISCRNVFIYLNRMAQDRALEILHFALLPEATLFLGTSESIEDDNLLFRTLDKKYRLYVRRNTPRSALPVPIGVGSVARALDAQLRKKDEPLVFQRASPMQIPAVPLELARGLSLSPEGRVSWSEVHFKLIERFAPPSLVVNEDYEILHLSENAGKFLQFTGGEPTRNLLRLVHPMLRIELRAGLFRALQTGLAVDLLHAPLEMEGTLGSVNIRITPGQECLLVVFGPDESSKPEETAGPRNVLGDVEEHLERELEQTKSALHETVEQYEASTEELKASNEELQAMNEELRSATEELETSREELQSINEELTTVNAELKSKVDDLVGTNSDLQNLMAATDIATVFVDRHQRIMRYTPSAVNIFHLIPGDLGRPLADLQNRLDYPHLTADAERVLDRLVPIEHEVGDNEGRWLVARLRPYRTADDRITGVVLTFVDITARKIAERALADSEAKFRTLADASPAIIWFLDGSGLMRYVNRSYLTFFGKREEAVLGVGLEPLVQEEDRASYLEESRVALRDERPLHTRARMLRRDGEWRWIDSHALPHFGEDGRYLGHVGHSVDITDTLAASAQLQASEDWYRVVFDSIDEGFAVVELTTDDTGRDDFLYLQCNPSCHKHSGLSDVVGKTLREVLPAIEQEWIDRIAHVARTGEPLQFRGMIGSLGRNIDLHASRVNEPSGRKVALLLTDVTTQKQREDALWTSQERLRLILENARDYAIVALDLDRRITNWNSGAERLLGFAEAEIVGRSADAIFTPEDCEAQVPQQEATTAISVGRATDERWHIRKDGSRFWGSGVMMAMRDTAGEVIGLVKIFRDQTEELEARQRLEQSQRDLWEALQEMEGAREEAEVAKRAKDHFLAVLSHELRTPLTPVLMAVQTLARQKDLSPVVAEALDMITRNIRLEARFIDDLLDVTRIENGKFEMQSEDLDLHEAVRHAVEVCTTEIHDKKQPLTVTLEATEHHLRGDVVRLQQVVWNLLKNASKFTPEGGAIHVQTRNEPGQILIIVSDGGIGFPPEAVHLIFDAFRQADTEVTRRFGGLGLGLAIAKATVDGHGGTIRATSAGRGLGAEFIVQLPLAGRSGENG